MIEPPKPEPITTTENRSIPTAALHWSKKFLRKVHRRESIDAGAKTFWAATEPFDLPGVCKDASPAEANTKLLSSLQLA